jgi:hypothetical protein
LLCIVAALWFARPEDEAHATQGAAVSSDFEASQQTGGNDDPPQRQGLRQRDIPSEESTARRDVGSDSATSTPIGKVPPAASETAQTTASRAAPGIGDQTSRATDPEPPPIDKTDCEAAARKLRGALALFDVTPTKVIQYGSGRPPDIPPVESAFTDLKTRLLAPLCSGTDAFDSAYPVESEFVGIGADAQVRILVGDHWISDGTVLSFLSEQDQNFFSSSYIQRRRQLERGRPRDGFERLLARNPQSLIAGP